jgi:hypothetical protein
MARRESDDILKFTLWLMAAVLLIGLFVGVTW